ncbi:hypothetical protein ABEG17_17205 [Pedococcus sp. KACC 23699]|uniref:DUF385 domain-containing protein n=1 Tax=Pedococcus sp. KACC 23699 TaxID=3149228 RepID=A0AAU7JSL3_9MICO
MTSLSPTPRRRSGGHLLVAATLRSPVRQALGHLTLLEYAAADGRRVRLPVQYARWRDELVLAAGRARDKTWWRAFRSPRRATLILDGVVLEGVGHVVRRDDPTWSQVAIAYQRVHPLARLDTAEIVLLRRL